MSDIAIEKSWQVLQTHGAEMASLHMRDLFAKNPKRAQKFWREGAGLALDFSKNRILPETMTHLLALAKAAGLEQKRAALFAGEKINTTEDRAVLHMALRDHREGLYKVDGKDVMPLVLAERAKMKSFCADIHSGKRLGASGKKLTTIVNIGIGGSDLGPAMVCEALKPYWLQGQRVFFVSNVDGADLAGVLQQIDPETTLFLIASKTFTTQETMTNAQSARQWFLAQGRSKADIARHFVALSTNSQAVSEFGIDGDNMFRFWDWVGGRYSLWSAIGLSIALTVGYDNFEKLLMGAHEMDRHFQQAPMEDNLPILLALIAIWNRNILGMSAHAVLPYDQSLNRFPAFLQQAEMESNGKSVKLDGTSVTGETCPVIFGEPGTNGQHAFYQMLHQGTDIISADFIAPARSHYEMGDHHAKLLANFLAQPQALMQGKSLAEVKAEMKRAGASDGDIETIAPHRVFPGNRPSNAIIFEKLTPQSLGALIALYEHKIFTQGVIWQINSFDQWGVELGKQMAGAILPELSVSGEAKPKVSKHDASTNRLLNHLNDMRQSGA